MKPSAVFSRAPALAMGLVLALALSLAGCNNPFVKDSDVPNPNAPKVTRVPTVTSTGRKAAVLSVHLRKEYGDACMYGVSLTNNLDVKVTNIAVRLSAYILNGVRYDTITRNFYELRPTETQYREVTFTGIKCSEIQYIGVADPGRCAVGQVNRFITEAGDCAKFIDVADTRLVSLRKERYQPSVGVEMLPPADVSPLP
jgi:hypothetical protein